MATLHNPPFRLMTTLMRHSSFSKTSFQLQHQLKTRWSMSNSSKCCKARTLSPLKVESSKCTRHEHITMQSQRLHSTNTASGEAQYEGPKKILSKYYPPTTGIISRLPPSWIPYAELIRLDKPAGTYYLFLPCLFSTLIAAPLSSPLAEPSTLIGTSVLFFTGALIMRGAGCTINDLWDRDLDPHVERTRLRPIARGAITVRQAIPYLGTQLLCGLAVLLQFPTQCLFYGVPSLLLVGSYPLAKRVTNYPQFVLGLTFSWGAMMGFPALGVDLLSNSSALAAAACLYGSCVAWTVVYDMIYAYQDIRDDAKAGIKSIALAQEANAKAFLTAVSAVQVALLAGAGIATGAGPVYFVGTCGGSAATLGYMIGKVRLNDVKDCWGWFRKGAWFTGGAISAGLAAEYLAQYFGWYTHPRNKK